MIINQKERYLVFLTELFKKISFGFSLREQHFNRPGYNKNKAVSPYRFEKKGSEATPKQHAGPSFCHNTNT